MCGVCDNYISLGNSLHHTPSGGLHHPLLLLPLDLGISLGILHLILDLLLCHLDVLVELMLLISIVGKAQDEIYGAYLDPHIYHHCSEELYPLHDRHIIEQEYGGKLILYR